MDDKAVYRQKRPDGDGGCRRRRPLLRRPLLRCSCLVRMTLIMRGLLLLLTASIGLLAQSVSDSGSWFTSLAPSDDGQVLYFASPLVLRDSISTVGERIFPYTSSGIELLATLAPPNVSDLTSVGVECSVDSVTVAWWDSALQATSAGSSGAVLAGAVASKGVTQAFNRSIALSRNGRYAVLFNGIDASGAILPPTLIDRVSGAQYSVPSAPYPYSTDVAGARQIIASTGELLLKRLLSSGDVQLSLWSPIGRRDFRCPRS
jgi:hypothetical protein